MSCYIIPENIRLIDLMDVRSQHCTNVILGGSYDKNIHNFSNIIEFIKRTLTIHQMAIKLEDVTQAVYQITSQISSFHHVPGNTGPIQSSYLTNYLSFMRIPGMIGPFQRITVRIIRLEIFGKRLAYASSHNRAVRSNVNIRAENSHECRKDITTPVRSDPKL